MEVPMQPAPMMMTSYTRLSSLVVEAAALRD